MTGLVYCPACGGPGKVERDVFGDEAVVCDAYEPCRDEMVEFIDGVQLVPPQPASVVAGWDECEERAEEWEERLMTWCAAARKEAA